MGNATNRQRRLRKARERQRHRAAGDGSASPHRTRQYGEAREPTTAEMAEMAIAETLDALASGQLDAYEVHVIAMATASAVIPDWIPAVSRLLVSLCAAAMTESWRRGWQPAELVRCVRRESGDHGARLAADMVAAEMRGYAVATVDDRWHAQVAELGAEAWWGNDDSVYLDRRRARDGHAVEEVLTSVFGLVLLLGRLPVMARLCPLPGTVNPAAARARASADQAADERVLAKVRALLAKPNPPSSSTRPRRCPPALRNS